MVWQRRQRYSLLMINVAKSKTLPVNGHPQSVEEPWDNQADIPIPQWQIDEVRRRLAEYEKNPVGAVTWEELEKEILG